MLCRALRKLHLLLWLPATPTHESWMSGHAFPLSISSAIYLSVTNKLAAFTRAPLSKGYSDQARAKVKYQISLGE